MTPDEQRIAYRKQCSFARRWHVIFVARDGRRTDEVRLTFTRTARIGNKKVDAPAINKAKRWVRTQPAGTVFVET